MDNVEKLLKEIIAALDGHTAATSEEADRILASGYLPVDEFIKRVKAAAKKEEESENSKPNVPTDK